MSKDTALALTILGAGIACFAAVGAGWPAPPPGMAYETDLKPHSLVVTNVAAAGAAYISPTNQAFAEAVKAVEMDIDTSLLAQLADYAGVDLPAAGATATGVLLAVIFAALGALKTNKADAKDVPFKLVEKSQDQKLDDRAYNHITDDVVASECKWSVESGTWDDADTEINPVNPNSIGVVKGSRGAEAEEVWLLYWKPGAENNDPEAGDYELSLTLLDESNGEPKDLGGPGNIPTGQMTLQNNEMDYSSNDRISLPAGATFTVENVGAWLTYKTYTNATVSFVDGSGEQVSLAIEDMTITKNVMRQDFMFELEGNLQGGSYRFYKFADSAEGDEFVDLSVGEPISGSVYDNESDERFSGTLILHENGTLSGIAGEIGGTVFAPLGLPDKDGKHAGVVTYTEIVGLFEAYLHGEDPDLDELSLSGLDFSGRIGPFILAESTMATFLAANEALQGLVSDEPPGADTVIPLRALFFDDADNPAPTIKAFVSYTPGTITLVPPEPEDEKTSRQFGVVLDGPVAGSVKFEGAETFADVSINSEATRTVLRVSEPVKNVFVVEKEAEKVEVSSEEETV